jgi:glycine oxidase
MTTRPRDILVVGGGVIGLSLARELAGRGLRVTVLDRGPAGQEASWAAAGMLVPQSDSPAPGPHFDLLLESHRLYPQWTRDLEEETGETVGYRRTGLLRCARNEAEERALEKYAWQRDRGLAVEAVGPEEIARRLGRNVAAVRAACLFPDEGVVDARRLTRALAESARLRGVDLRTETAARRFRIAAGRCRGVDTSTGVIEAEIVVNASGAWASFDRELPFPVPVEPVRGQIVELALPGDAPETILESNDAYLAPQEGGRLLLGSTLERAGFEKRVTAGAVGRLIAEAGRLWPAITTGRFVTAWAGLRPGTPDGLPILGGCGIAGLYFATGHYRHGILLAPATARRLADLLTGGPAPDLTPFSLSRFGPGRGAAAWTEASAPEDFK